MSDLQKWIRARCPESPMELGSWIDVSGVTEPSTHDLMRVALDALEQARLCPGRIRASAFQLLAADALITYACESALDAEDPDLVLGIVIQQAAASS